MLVRASSDGQLAGRLAVPNGRAARDEHGTLVVGTGPGDWRLLSDDVEGIRSYLLYCERSSGQHLCDAILDAGGEFGVVPDGFDYP